MMRERYGIRLGAGVFAAALACAGVLRADEAAQTTDTLVLRETLEFHSIGAEDGYVREAAEGTGSPGKSDIRDSIMMVGDTRENCRAAAFLSFDIPTMDEATQIHGARLRLSRKNIFGSPSALGPILVDVMTPDGIAVPELKEVTVPTTVDPNIHVQTFAIPKDTDGTGTVVIDAEFFPILRGGKVGARIGATDSTNGNKVADYVALYSGDASPRFHPALEIDIERTIPIPAQPTPSAPLGEPATLVLWSDAGQDGEITESAKGSGTGGGANRASPTIMIGDNSRGAQSKALLSFDTSAIPAGAFIDSASLGFHVTKVYGKPGALGPFHVEGRLAGLGSESWRFGADAAADPSDFRAQGHPLGLRAPAAFGENSPVSVALTPIAIAGLNRIGPSQFLLQFEKGTNGDALADGVLIGSGNGGEDLPATPRLTVTYRLPATK